MEMKLLQKLLLNDEELVKNLEVFFVLYNYRKFLTLAIKWICLKIWVKMILLLLSKISSLLVLTVTETLESCLHLNVYGMLNSLNTFEPLNGCG